ncbi:hotdog fold domain-containing protein [Rudaeicoccus suwonensis]|uniref:Uncharacterized protein DUF4442 n=1 Tax=Rudaeicoccus suwonensis TaxID=657409 RepID=A0A561E9R3_9MICO|nr:hotdog fold domain-containing protein [Rudaeicoccus suwonensis]TWE12349.1 uncharacterized protein DUF4442 [Rudaeicoccus suwonensis]
MNPTYAMYRKASRKPFGRRLFSLGYMFKAPYFASVQPQVVDMAPNRAVVRIRNWKGVQNHLGTMHAIAVANGMEAAMGLLAEASVKPRTRWIPKGIQLEYLAKVTAAVECVAQTDPADWDKPVPHQVDIRVSGALPDGTEVVRGVIPVWVTAVRD